MKLKFSLFLFLIAIGSTSFVLPEHSGCGEDAWGFFGHRRINRLAVFTLPAEMSRFYKKHIEFVTEHAVDPDKRRYATKHEGHRHYIDVDHWGTYPFDNMPRKWTDALVKYTDVFVIRGKADTIQLMGHEVTEIDEGNITMKGNGLKRLFNKESVEVPYKKYKNFYQKTLIPQYHKDNWKIKTDSLEKFFGELGHNIDIKKIYVKDRLTKYGVLPWNLEKYQYRLQKAFETGNVKRVLQLSADIGHYIGDAHVPLHTTENYNGQLTNQVGIHAFWESRLPEMYADSDYDFFVGKALYFDDANKYYWDVVLKSHTLLPEVLAIEKRLSKTFPPDKQYCYEQRNELTVRTQCYEYAAAYHKELGGMVETRMRDAILSVGSAWMTAWVNAGQPDLENFREEAWTDSEIKEAEKLDQKFKGGDIKGRKH